MHALMHKDVDEDDANELITCLSFCICHNIGRDVFRINELSETLILYYN